MKNKECFIKKINRQINNQITKPMRRYFGDYRNGTALLAMAGFLLFTLTVCKANEFSVTKINTLTEEEQRKGWELVFDGKTLEGWRGLNKDQVPERHWVIEDGLLRKIPRDSIELKPNETGISPRDLMLDRPLHDFEFAFEWKISEGGNSGVKYNVTEEISATARPHSALGFEYQILDDNAFPEIKEHPSWATAGLYDLVDPEVEVHLNPAGEWNSGRIVCRGNRAEHWLNGDLILSYEINSPEMEALLRESKWSQLEDFGKRHKEAYIVLQYHTGAVWFRNIKLREWR